MCSIEEYVNLLDLSVTNKNNNIQEITETLTNLLNSPGIFDILFQIICFPKSDRIFTASVIQLKKLLSINANLVEQIPIEKYINVYNNISNIRSRKVLEYINEAIVSYYFKCGSIETILDTIEKTINSGSPISFALLRNLYKLNDGHIDSTFCLNFLQYLISGLSYINQKLSSDINDELFQYQTSLISKSLKKTMKACHASNVPSEIKSTFLNISLGLLNSEFEDKHNVLRNITEALEQLIISENEKDMPETNVVPYQDILTLILNGISKSSLSNRTRTSMIRILKSYFIVEKLYPLIQDTLVHIITNVLYPQLLLDFESEDINFSCCETLQIIFSKEPYTPFSAALDLLSSKDAVQRRFLLSCIIDMCLKADVSNVSVAYGIMCLVGSVVNDLPCDLLSDCLPLIHLAVQFLEQEDQVHIISGCVLLSRIPYIDGLDEVPHVLIQVILNSENNVILRYFSIIAFANIINFFNGSRKEMNRDLSHILGHLSETLFNFESIYPTMEMSYAIIGFTDFFSDFITSNAMEYFNRVLELFISNGNTPIISNYPSIFETFLRNTFSDQKLSESLCSSLLITMIDFLNNGNDSLIEEYLMIIESCVTYIPNVTDQILELHEVLFNVFTEQEIFIEGITGIVRALFIRFPEIFTDETRLDVYFSIAKKLYIGSDAVAASEPESSLTYLQIFFVGLSNHQRIVDEVSDIINLVANTNYEDLISTLAVANPVAALSKLELFQSWIENSRPVIFLLSFRSVWLNIEQLQDFVQLNRETIFQKAKECYTVFSQHAHETPIDPLQKPSDDGEDVTLLRGVTILDDTFYDILK